MLLSNRLRLTAIATFALLALPAAKGGCGSDVPIGQDGDECRSNSQCGSSSFCDWNTNSCGLDETFGTCTPIPQACDEIYDPVCGCDGQTYGNACAANTAGVSIASQGECDPGQGGGGQGGGGPETCGGLGGIQCDAGEFCDWQDMSCGSADQEGVCTPIPEGCTFEYDPVCGCDGQTYGNACAANNAGVSVAASGECPSSGQACGGFGGIACDPGEFCDWEDMSCGGADQEGICKPEPQICNDIFQPVCGCDNMTYGNACEANAVGVSVISEGPC